MRAPDEFDPNVERLFSQAPVMADSARFAEVVERRLSSRTRFRTVLLGAAGLVGGVIAVRETLGVSARFGAASPGEGVASLTASAAPTVEGLVDSGVVGLGVQTLQGWQAQLDLGLDLGGLGGAQLFWAVAAVLIAAAVMTGMKLVSEI